MSGGLLGLQLFKPSTDTQILGDNALGGLLLDTSGVTREMARQTAMITEAAKPEEAYGKFKTAAETAANATGSAINAHYAALRAEGIPADQAKNEAIKLGQTLYEAELKVLKLKHPIATSADSYSFVRDALARAQIKKTA